MGWRNLAERFGTMAFDPPSLLYLRDLANPQYLNAKFNYISI
jgi:hypothetical protein